jgi:hypothetical protein
MAAAVAPQRILDGVVLDADDAPEARLNDCMAVGWFPISDPPKLALGEVERSGLGFVGNGDESLESNKSAGGVGTSPDDLFG